MLNEAGLPTNTSKKAILIDFPAAVVELFLDFMYHANISFIPDRQLYIGIIRLTAQYDCKIISDRIFFGFRRIMLSTHGSRSQLQLRQTTQKWHRRLSELSRAPRQLVKSTFVR